MTRTSRDTRTCVIRVSTGKTPLAKTGLVKISRWRPFPVNQCLPSTPVPASGVYLGKYSGHFPALPPAVGSPLLVSRGGVVRQAAGRRLMERSAVDSAPWPTLERLRRGPFRPPVPSARLRCSADPSAAACAAGSAALRFPAIPGWRGNGRHQGLAGNGDHDRYSLCAEPPRPVRMPGRTERQQGTKGEFVGCQGSP